MPGSIPAPVDEQVAASSIPLQEDGHQASSEGSGQIRTVGKTPVLPTNNPLQFVKVQSPLYIKAEQQIKLTKEVKISREALKEGEEEWQSNLDDWKSRRRKVSEKVLQRAEEMRQIEAEEQLRKDKLQRKIKKFSEIVDKKSSRSYNLDLYIGAGDDSGLGATPEPDETLDCPSLGLRSDTSEGGMTSEAESIDSDSHKMEKITEKEPPKVPQKSCARFKRSASLSYSNDESQFFHPKKALDLNSSTEPSDVEGHAADTEATSSEEDGLPDCLGDDTRLQESEEDRQKDHSQLSNGYNQSFKICIKHGDVRGFGFTLKGGKDQGSPAYIENIVKGSPAEEIGLKDGDKIISLNGELSAEYSHASLIFSIKQALYTGILEIVINRSDHCEIMNAETKTSESRKGKSFAEKLAIFTAGVNAPTASTVSKSSESKKESLVLRRRSAFENGKPESMNAVNRISQPHNTGCGKTLEKRHSVDFAIGQYITLENTSNKKGPPPPVPAKPKFKTKLGCFPPNKSVTKANETVSPPSGTEKSASNLPNEPQNVAVCSVSSEKEHQRTIPDLKSTNETEADEENTAYSFSSKTAFSLHEVKAKIDDISSNETQLSLNVHQSIPICCDFDLGGGQETDKRSASFEANELEATNILSNVNEFESNILEYLGEEMCKDSFEGETHVTEEIYDIPKQLTNGVSSEHFDIRSTTDDLRNIGINNCAENISKEIDAEVTSILSACYSACDTEVTYQSHVTETLYNQTLEESETSESKNDRDTNSSSQLCLSLEKIDEDDVISASTTTSSDTPDTETVIETLPTNLSPLPNDESDGEDSSKLFNNLDDQPLETSSCTVMSSSGTNDGKDILQNCDDQVVKTTQDCLEDYNSSVSNNMDMSYYEDQQDEEYAHELDESLDQITSLDIIDRIEQSLMDQLQKEDSYEDMNSPLERSIEDPWLYYSEESEFLEDLTPRNSEPPREPPPPPPPPELEKKTVPIARTDSTKRIQKELLRRRSDFLGLQSPEPFHVDSILPPPPLLEELLKQQTQWLEKRSESPIEVASCSVESSSLETRNYSNNEYSNYFVEEKVEIPLETQPEQWKGNMDEDSLFDSTYGLQYKSAPENGIENTKLCESPQHKAKHNIQNLGAAPKAKIMDSTQWISDKDVTEPQMCCNLNGSRTSRRYSMPNTHPDVTVRTWGDREYDYIQHRPASAIYNRPCADNQHGKKNRQSLDLGYETESDVHKCSCCGKGLSEGSAMGIEALRLYFHIECFRCCFCSIQLGNGSCGTDVQVKNNQLYCPSCFTVD